MVIRTMAMQARYRRGKYWLYSNGAKIALNEGLRSETATNASSSQKEYPRLYRIAQSKISARQDNKRASVPKLTMHRLPPPRRRVMAPAQWVDSSASLTFGSVIACSIESAAENSGLSAGRKPFTIPLAARARI